jgi:death on curing protein
LICNHPFIDGNKRVGHAAMETFLMLNGLEISASVDEQEKVIMQVAAGNMLRESFRDWIAAHVQERSDA